MIRFAGDRLYTGITVDVQRRLREHQIGAPRGARALRGKGPLELVWQSPAVDHVRAARLECWLKRRSKALKQAFLEGHLQLPEWWGTPSPCLSDAEQSMATMSDLLPSCVTLVGFRACGKTTLARRLAQRLGWPALDLDQRIVDCAGITIPEIFSKGGEDLFRDWEQRVLQDVLAQAGPQVVATGGGVVVRQENRDLLQRQGGIVVYLQASAKVLATRLRRNPNNRPSLRGRHPADEVAELLAERDPWYR
ncbi:MAG: hypothetical protein EA402_13875, partial [Planctomycetota bacterium]